MNIVDENGNSIQDQQSKRVLVGILAILLGAFGIHKFVLGYNSEGAIMLIVTIVLGVMTCGFAAWAMGVISLIEGIIYLTKSDEEFISIYQIDKKGWF